MKCSVFIQYSKSGVLQPLLWHKLLFPQTLALWAWGEFEKAKSNLLKLKVVCYKDKVVWAHYIKAVQHQPHFCSRFRRKNVFVAFPEHAGFERQSRNYTEWCCWHKWCDPCHKPNSGPFTYAGFPPQEGMCNLSPFPTQRLFRSYCGIYKIIWVNKKWL